MEMEAALKTSIRKEMAFKPSPQVVFDDLLGGNGQNVVTCDDFFVDDLLDFSNGDGFVEEEPEEEEDKGFASVSPSKQAQELESSNPIKHEFVVSVPSTELTVPAYDLANLEWLSHFVDDSFTEFSVPFPAGVLPEKPKIPTEQKPHSPAKPCFTTPVPAKARSKRSRTGVRVWSLGSPSLTDSSSSPSSSSSSSQSSPWLIYTTQANQQVSSSGENPMAKKQKKKQGREASGGFSSQPPRRCSHCGVQKTPQWRTGPLGAKTLCNACGVRFKSGRLLPEYRPACSPTFSSELHSNHHRKVMEMRRKKETEPELAPAVVPSF
ncbi:hypothetical protein UlMin_039837 [Ulmus minor]